MTTTLITERLTLTPVAVADYDDLKALWADPAFVRHIFPEPLTSEDVWFRLLRDIGHWETLGHGNWTVRLKDTGEYVGSVGVLDGAAILDFVEDQLVAAIEIEDAELLARLVLERQADVGQQRGP